MSEQKLAERFREHVRETVREDNGDMSEWALGRIVDGFRLALANSTDERHCGWQQGDGPCRLVRDNACDFCLLHIEVCQLRHRPSDAERDGAGDTTLREFVADCASTSFVDIAALRTRARLLLRDLDAPSSSGSEG